MGMPTRPVILVAAALATATGTFGSAGTAGAQAPEGRVQLIAGRLRSGETDLYLLEALAPGDRLAVAMRATSGNLDPAIGILDTSLSAGEAVARYSADAQGILAESGDVALALGGLRDRYFLAWDDDGGPGYGSALEFVIPAAGDYMLAAAGSLSALGRATWGEYELTLGLNAPDAPDGEGEPAGAPIAALMPSASAQRQAVEVITGTLTAAAPVVVLALVDFDAGETLTAHLEAISGSLASSVILRDFGGKPVDASALPGSETTAAALEHTFGEDSVGYSLEVRAAPMPDGAATEGDYRLAVGRNAPDVLAGQAEPRGDPVLDAPIEVQVGMRIFRISAVNSQDESYTVLASLRMDWTDPALAFSPDSCGCLVKLYTEKELDRFLADVRSRWPAFTLHNQLGNRWAKSRVAAIWPDGRARYGEDFSATFQADFDFRQYPFDTQSFPIFLDMLYPTDHYTTAALPGYSEIDPEHGEDEFIITDFTAAASTVAPTAADQPVARMTYNFAAPRHLYYYVLQVFLPIALIILISWFTFFLRDYTRRIEAAAANVLLFIAFSFSLADNYPRLGYLTFLDAVMTVTFAVNVVVLLYNVNMKRLENRGLDKRIERVDQILDWAYPLIYAGLIALVAVWYF